MMTTSEMCHFLLVYDHHEHRLVKTEEFAESADATEAYSAAEREAREQAHTHLEIVLIGADTLETITETHASYFEGTVPRSRFLVGT